MIQQLFDHFGYTRRVNEQKAVIIWDMVVGSEIAEVTEAKSIRNGILRVSVSDPAWRYELTYLKEDICHKINREIGHSVVSDIKFC